MANVNSRNSKSGKFARSRLRCGSNQASKARPLKRFRSGNRSGVAAVECAVCLLILTPIIFGTLEVCAGVLAKQSLTVSAYEGVRAGVGRGTTNADILTRTAQVLEFRGVSLGDGSTSKFAKSGDKHGIFLITPDGRPVEELDALDPITVRIVAPSEGNATPVFEHLLNRDIVVAVTMVREFDAPVSTVSVD